MRVSAQAFWSPKAGNHESEYEDALWPDRQFIGGKNSIFRFAVGDGATETSFSGIWAKQLVRAFCKGELEHEAFLQSLRVLREKWHKIVSRKPMPWYAEEKIRSGAFAAILGLVLNDLPEPKEDGKWRALAIGDSCVAQLRKREVVTSFPIQNSDQFNNSPFLLGSKSTPDQSEIPALLTTSGTWRKGDTFYLMSDAIACWFLKQVERGRVPDRELRDLSFGKSGDFPSWLAALRRQKVVRNDDVTIVRVEIEKF